MEKKELLPSWISNFIIHIYGKRIIIYWVSDNVTKTILLLHGWRFRQIPIPTLLALIIESSKRLSESNCELLAFFLSIIRIFILYEIRSFLNFL